MAKENYWVVKVGVMKLWRGLCQAMDFAALEKGKTMAKEYIEREKALEKVIEVKHYDPELSGVALHRYIKEIDLKDIPAADVAPAGELEDLRAKYQALVAEKDKNSGDTAETYTTGYRYGHRNGQIELLQQILGICDGVSEPEETNE